MRKRSLSLAGLPIVLLLPGCAVEDTDHIIENAVAAQENLESYYAEVVSTYSFEQEENTINYQEWHVRPEKHRMEMDDGYIYVSNGEQSWSYNEEENTVSVFENLGEMTEDLPDESDMMREMLTEMMNSNKVKAEGKETVANRPTIHLSLSPKGNEAAEKMNGHYEIWIDEETYMPLKMVWEDENFHSETVYEHIEFNIDLEEDLFTFEIPEGAEIESVDHTPESLTLEELQNETEDEIPELTEIPEGYEFQDAMHFKDFGESMIEYMNDSGEYLILSVSEEKRGIEEEKEDELLEIGRYVGTYSDMYDMQFLSWNTGKFHLELITSSEELSKEDLLGIAEKIE
ncbi:outer membrane lipoprotein-sorting protein [Salipaludibacillus aurantiacus]|uniref:Outer membrane lipoprotein-sorting protein n=1 Tax=Salipaludibacillus aurantiacus TaxID=1601833 RepID=A0A1H9UZ99_9BACI|nr:outer membrane lipoprotein-sorting protein [Salipaludibacillus aurantiacus]SES14679.1 Outer membrane lipoprotein-sorting protein [Salipaludibacillus aurantiacus]